MQNVSTGFHAPELRVTQWIDGEGQSRPPLVLRDLGSGYKLLYCFQHWCPGCHSHGFPTVKRIVETLSLSVVGVAVIQTVFEGEDVNTLDRLRETQLRYDLRVPFGHDSVVNGYPTVMQDYGTRGTPWFILIDPAGDVVYGGFHFDADALRAAINEVR